MKMKPKRQGIDHDDAVAIVRGYHADGRSQTELARAYGLSISYVHDLVHGKRRKAAYAQVEAEPSPEAEGADGGIP